MSLHLGRRAATALLGAVLTVGLVAGPAQAGPRSPDPELTQQTAAAGRATAPSSQRAAASIDSDVYAYASSPTFRLYFVLAGRLRLQLKSGSTTKYKGSFIDYTGNKSYEASADATDPAAPTIKLKSKNGTFEVVSHQRVRRRPSSSATGTKVPSKLKVEAARWSSVPPRTRRARAATASR